MTDGPTAYNPLGIQNLATSVYVALMDSDPTPLGNITKFQGAGVYALYYTGDFPAYQALAAANADGQLLAPIYVGKAVPKGARKGIAVAITAATRVLATRLNEHAKSIQAAENLDLADFAARWLVVEPIWIPLGESMMINRHGPLWNGLTEGFGNHDPGKGRIAGVRTRWDTLHPGRPWAPNYPPRLETPEQIGADAVEYLRQRHQV